MCDIFDIIANISINNNKKYQSIYQQIQPYIVQQFELILNGLKHDTRGRKRKIDLNKFFECVFCVCDNSLKLSYVKLLFGIPKTTYCYYFNILKNSGLLENINQLIVTTLKPRSQIDYVVTDTYTFIFDLI